MLLRVYSNRFLRNHPGMGVPRVFPAETGCDTGSNLKRNSKHTRGEEHKEILRDVSVIKGHF